MRRERQRLLLNPSEIRLDDFHAARVRALLRLLESALERGVGDAHSVGGDERGVVKREGEGGQRGGEKAVIEREERRARKVESERVERRVARQKVERGVIANLEREGCGRSPLEGR